MIWPIAFAVLLQLPGSAQELAPGTRYDPSIPTLEQVVGHDFREEITPPDGIIRYMEALHRGKLGGSSPGGDGHRFCRAYGQSGRHQRRPQSSE